ncbi:MAG: efflux RND transporter periplasmic adaptor subunit, partial [bacterium]
MHKRRIRNAGLILILIGLLGGSLYSCKREETYTEPAGTEGSRKEEGENILYWTCGMHPSVRVPPEQYEKGQTKCPICNMDLVPVGEEREAPGEHEGVVLKLSQRARELASVRISEVACLPVVKEIHTVGRMDYDERRMAYVASWIAGRIDKLFVDFTGTLVRKGEPLVLLYSPALIS